MDILFTTWSGAQHDLVSQINGNHVHDVAKSCTNENQYSWSISLQVLPMADIVVYYVDVDDDDDDDDDDDYGDDDDDRR